MIEEKGGNIPRKGYSKKVEPYMRQASAIKLV